MTDSKFNGPNDQLINTSLRLEDILQVRIIISVFILIIAVVGSKLASAMTEAGKMDFELSPVAVIAFFVLWSAFTVLITYKPFKNANAFKKAHPEAYKQGQYLLRSSSASERNVFNKKSELNQRIYGSN